MAILFSVSISSEFSLTYYKRTKSTYNYEYLSFFQAAIRQKNEVIDDIQEITVRLRTLNLSSYEFASLEAIVLFKPGKHNYTSIKILHLVDDVICTLATWMCLLFV